MIKFYEGGRSIGVARSTRDGVLVRLVYWRGGYNPDVFEPVQDSPVEA